MNRNFGIKYTLKECSDQNGCLRVKFETEKEFQNLQHEPYIRHIMEDKIDFSIMDRFFTSVILCPWLDFGLPPRFPQVLWYN